jgi:excisionase family DNA binding protein
MLKKTGTTAQIGRGAFSVEETADFFGISRASVWRLFKSGGLPKTRIGGRTVVRRVDAEAFLEKCSKVA